LRSWMPTSNIRRIQEVRSICSAILREMAMSSAIVAHLFWVVL
jgi:hypothetical protein